MGSKASKSRRAGSLKENPPLPDPLDDSTVTGADFPHRHHPSYPSTWEGVHLIPSLAATGNCPDNMLARDLLRVAYGMCFDRGFSCLPQPGWACSFEQMPRLSDAERDYWKMARLLQYVVHIAFEHDVPWRGTCVAACAALVPLPPTPSRQSAAESTSACADAPVGASTQQCAGGSNLPLAVVDVLRNHHNSCLASSLHHPRLRNGCPCRIVSGILLSTSQRIPLCVYPLVRAAVASALDNDNRGVSGVADGACRPSDLGRNTSVFAIIRPLRRALAPSCAVVSDFGASVVPGAPLCDLSPSLCPRCLRVSFRAVSSGGEGRFLHQEEVSSEGLSPSPSNRFHVNPSVAAKSTTRPVGGTGMRCTCSTAGVIRSTHDNSTCCCRCGTCCCGSYVVLTVRVTFAKTATHCPGRSVALSSMLPQLPLWQLEEDVSQSNARTGAEQTLMQQLPGMVTMAELLHLAAEEASLRGDLSANNELSDAAGPAIHVVRWCTAVTLPVTCKDWCLVPGCATSGGATTPDTSTVCSCHAVGLAAEHHSGLAATLV